MIETPKSISTFAFVMANVDGNESIAFTSTILPSGGNHFVLFTPAHARKMAKQLSEMADFLDPPPKEWRVVGQDGTARKSSRKRVAKKRKSK